MTSGADVPARRPGRQARRRQGRARRRQADARSARRRRCRARRSSSSGSGSRDVDKRATQARQDKRKRPRIRTARRPSSDEGAQTGASTSSTTGQPAADRQRPPRPQISQDASSCQARAQAVKRITQTRRAARRAAQTRETRIAEKARDERARVEDDALGRAAGARQHVGREFAREFGSHWRVGPRAARSSNPRTRPKRSGVIHATQSGRREGRRRDRGAKGHLDARDRRASKATPPGETAGYAVVPARGRRRFAASRRVGTAPGHRRRALRVGSRQFRKTVLPLSTKWLGGQVIEGATRAAVHGAGPASLLRYRKPIASAASEDASRTRRRQLRACAPSSGGQFGVTGPAAEFAGKRAHARRGVRADRSRARPAAAVTKAAAAARGPARPRRATALHRRRLQRHQRPRSSSSPRQAMLGKAVKQGAADGTPDDRPHREGDRARPRRD